MNFRNYRFPFVVLLAVVFILIGVLTTVYAESFWPETKNSTMSPASTLTPANVQWKLLSDRTNLRRSGIRGVYDTARDRIVTFSGLSSTGEFLTDTLEFDGENWLAINPSHTPPARKWYGLVYDSNRHVVILFGGRNDDNNFNDTWEYDGHDWRQINTSHAPSPRNGFAMVYDSCRNKVVLFGGDTDSG